MKHVWGKLFLVGTMLALLLSCEPGLGPEGEAILDVLLILDDQPYLEGADVQNPLLVYYELSSETTYQLRNIGNDRLYYPEGGPISFESQSFESRDTTTDTLERFTVETQPVGEFLDPGTTADFVVSLSRIDFSLGYDDRGWAEATMRVSMEDRDGDPVEFTFGYYADVC
jgi:hypothetical protein